MKRDFLKLIALVLVVALFLTACGYRIGQNEKTETDSEPAGDKEDDRPQSVTALEGEITNPEDDVFTLCWQKEKTLNPYKEMTAENAAVTELVYEGLFTVTPDFTAEPCICSHYSVTGTEYTFYLKDGVTFHDGETLTATDAVYSMERAMEGDRFGPRLLCVERLEYVSDLCFRMILKAENNTLPLLLDIPIVKYGTAGDDSPTGTGPYMLEYSEERLTAYGDYKTAMPLETIYLYDVTGESPALAISERKVDLIPYDTSAGTLDVYTDHETRYFESTILQYIGFNTKKSVLSHSEVRRALSHLVNREAVLEPFAPGSITNAGLILSPASKGYDPNPKAEADYSVRKFTDILNEHGAKDSDGDGWLEFDGYTMSFDFIVCKDSPSIVYAAREIAADMKNVGIKINLEVLGYEDYMTALMTGNFDMYYAEVRLPANFDLTEILGSGGRLNYGGYSGFDEALSAWLTAKSDEEKAEASSALCGLVCEEAPVIPVCYRKNAVAIPRGRVFGMEPGQQCLFRGFENWEINLKS